MLNRLVSGVGTRSLVSSTLMISLAMFGPSGCKPPADDSYPEAYVDEHGEMWAYGSVQVSALSTSGKIMLKRVTSDQNLDTSQSGPSYDLFGQMEALGGGRAKRSIAYVDFHPHRTNLLAYAFSLKFAKIYGNPNNIAIYAVLKRPGPSYFNRYGVQLGFAYFDKGKDITEVRLASGVKVSLIASGVYAGQWALHYAEAKRIVVTPWSGMCVPDGGRRPGQFPGQGLEKKDHGSRPDQVPGQLPGQNPRQNPGQTVGCNVPKPKDDLCGGDPTASGCRPPAPASQEFDHFQAVAGEGLDRLAGEDRVFTMAADFERAKLVFVFEDVEVAGEAENAALCADRFMAFARTLANQVNRKCTLTPSPAGPVEGKLSCGLTVGLMNPQTYMEKICNVTGIYKSDGNQIHNTVQILKG